MSSCKARLMPVRRPLCHPGPSEPCLVTLHQQRPACTTKPAVACLRQQRMSQQRMHCFTISLMADAATHYGAPAPWHVVQACTSTRPRSRVWPVRLTGAAAPSTKPPRPPLKVVSRQGLGRASDLPLAPCVPRPASPAEHTGCKPWTTDNCRTRSHKRPWAILNESVRKKFPVESHTDLKARGAVGTGPRNQPANAEAHPRGIGCHSIPQVLALLHGWK